MPRHARLRLPGFPLHVVQRGINRSVCFGDDSDRTLYLGLLGELAPLFGCEVHAFVLMGNHVHLLLTPQQPESSSLLMKNLGQRYVQNFNRRHARTGSLWEGRFHSSIVDTENYFLCCQRYIELNPVRAKMVGHPAAYRWSSYRTHGLGEPSHFLTLHGCYLGLGPDPAARQSSYAAFCDLTPVERELQQIRAAVSSGFILGSEAFVKGLGDAIGKRGLSARKRRPNPRRALSAFLPAE